ncbi:MAG: hypothetical protein RBS08_08585 [Bdellovibrionales bacterium]|jgi:hypothetical protein|nr:hypothetical protein [Bdellovibrionales bacterium]
MKSQFVSGSSSAHEQYLDCSLRGMTTDTRGGASAALIADIRIMQDFAAANPDKANTARLNAWVDKVLGGNEPDRPAPTRAKGMTSTR